MTIKYKIFTDFHYSLPPYPFLHYNIKEMKYKIKFDKACWYTRNEIEYSGINKLCGLGFGLNHHNNSILIGWQPDFENKDVILLYAYWYDSEQDGTHQSQLICTMQTNTEFSAGIKLLEDKYEVSINENRVNIPNNFKDKNWGFYLRPYFGGKSESPHKMEIDIEYNKYKL
jgi:hypothetical protein